MCSTISLEGRAEQINGDLTRSAAAGGAYSPINPAGALLRLYVNVIMIDFQFRDFHLKKVGLELDCPAHGAKIWP